MTKMNFLFPDDRQPRSRCRNKKRRGKKYADGTIHGCLKVLSKHSVTMRQSGGASYETFNCECLRCGEKVTYTSVSLRRNLEFCSKCGTKGPKAGGSHNVGDIIKGRGLGSYEIIDGPTKLKNGNYGWRMMCTVCKRLTRSKPVFSLGGCRWCYSERKKTPLGLVRQVHLAFVKGAAKRGIDVEIGFEQWLSIVIKPCFYCGCIFSNRRENHGKCFRSNGVDRYDNKKPYTIENSVTACWPCNIMKSSMSVDTFITKCRLISERMKELKVSPPEFEESLLRVRGCPNNRKWKEKWWGEKTP